MTSLPHASASKMIPTYVVLTTLVVAFLCLDPTTAFVFRKDSGRVQLPLRSEGSFKRSDSSKNHPRSRSVLLRSSSTGMEDNVLLLPLLEAKLAKLQQATAADAGADDFEDDEEAPSDFEDAEARRLRKIRELTETIDNAKTAAEFGVRRVQNDFYDAFSNANLDKMRGVWSSNASEDVRCSHPGMPALLGIRPVMESWKQIFFGYAGGDDRDAFKIAPTRVSVDICGRTAICTCIEETSGGRLEALNVYRRENGTWKMINHMASPIIMRDVM